MTLRIGCGPFPPSRKRYFAQFTIVEIADTFHDLIKSVTLERWAEEAPEGFAWVLVAPQWISQDRLDFLQPPPDGYAKKKLGFFEDTDDVRRLWDQTVRMAEAVGAASILFKTPATFSPSSANHDAIRHFASEISSGASASIVWEPRGLWEVDQARALGDEVGWTVALDPFVDKDLPEFPSGDGYYVLTAPRGRRRFDIDDHEQLLDYFEDHEGADVAAIFRGPDREKNAAGLLKTLDRRLEDEED